MAGAAKISREMASGAASPEVLNEVFNLTLVNWHPGSGALGKLWEIHCDALVAWFVLN